MPTGTLVALQGDCNAPQTERTVLTTAPMLRAELGAAGEELGERVSRDLRARLPGGYATGAQFDEAFGALEDADAAAGIVGRALKFAGGAAHGTEFVRKLAAHPSIARLRGNARRVRFDACSLLLAIDG